MKYSKDFFEDMECSLDEIERGWIRKPVTVFLSIFLLIIMAVFGAVGGLFKGMAESVIIVWNDFTVDCWKGPDLTYAKPVTEMELPQVDKALEILEDQEERLYQQKRTLLATKKYLTEQS